MIPSVLSDQLRRGIEDFLTTTFPVSTPHFAGIVERLLARKDGVFKGPYLSLGLPFRQGSGSRDRFKDIPLPFPPFLHQEKAFDRLGAQPPRSTLISTGTGSGKTECFLYPILSHCLARAGEPGIKAILIYPMNALAADQAGRIARTVFDTPALKGKVTAGLYVGQSEKDPHLTMDRTAVITNKEAMRRDPPDILLTNYKMLDYLLIRARDEGLWAKNDPKTLQFLIVDELHTFDGAQGTDLACLIRRLKARLTTPKGHLCCVGTSATLGGGEGDGDLVEYAGSIFGEPFEKDAVITESRLSAEEFLTGSPITRTAVPPVSQDARLSPETYPDREGYIRDQHALWFGDAIPEDYEDPAWRIGLGVHLKGHAFFRHLLTILGGDLRSFDDVLPELSRLTPEFREGSEVYRNHVLNSLLALVSEARTGSSDAPLPFLHVRLQLWLRELRRMVASVAATPELAFSDDLKEEQRNRHLPAIHCRECGVMGWGGVKAHSETTVKPDLQDFYIAYFNEDPTTTILFPEERPKNEDRDGTWARLCAECLTLPVREDAEECPDCGGGTLIPVFLPDQQRTTQSGRRVVHHNCPYCGAHDSLTILGSRAASLTAVLIAQLFSSTYNEDKKLLTFSDSVQDAAHRAGFFAARTYRFNFRTALQQFILQHGAGLSLEALPTAFIDHWAATLGDEAYITTFLAPDMAWMGEYENLMRGTLADPSTFRDKYVDKRVRWEIVSEFGFSARIGRTLEKTGSSIAHVTADHYDRIVPGLLEILQNEIGGLRDLEEPLLRRFLLGMVTQMRTRGALFLPVLDEYIKAKGQTYLLNRVSWLPNFGPQTRAPAFLSNGAWYRFDALSGSRNSWPKRWAVRCFGDRVPGLQSLLMALYEPVLDALKKEGILREQSVKGKRVWGLLPDALTVSPEVDQVRCTSCGHQVSSPGSERALWDGMPCFRAGCGGTYGVRPPQDDYYGKLYATGDLRRIFAEEHTALLTREKREEIEERFKAEDPAPWDPNLLSCTPTLEMGIDIGDLSSAILCSVPPAQSNYIQRIGRTGRRDGNALNLTVANARPHDLYFFADPADMITGTIQPPGVFLNASAVLERQFTGYCFDRWVQQEGSRAAVPNEMREVLSSLKPVSPTRFPHNFIHFVESNTDALVRDFLALFEGLLTGDSIAHIHRFAAGDEAQGMGLAYRIMNELHAQLKERTSLQKKADSLKKKIRALEAKKPRQKADEETHDELDREYRGLRALLHRLNSRVTFNFFTDAGLIPNYAFPEAGVVLRSIIYRKRTTMSQDGKKYDTWTFEVERAAAAAIRELAPKNRFYGLSRKVQIDQVDMGVSDIEMWRLCPDCAHSELEVSAPQTTVCPRCASPLWGDAGQKRPMLRIKQVIATTSDKESRIGDDSDSRDPCFYNQQMLVEVDTQSVIDAYRIDRDDLPFGFEFLSRASFREINFGEKGGEGDSFYVAGKEMPRKGFTLCRYCGKLQEGDGKVSHALYCSARSKEADATFMECVYLYRDFTSEAIRILLPFTTFAGSDEKLHSFIAAIHLGLKSKFKGNIDHLQTTVIDAPVPGEEARKRFLVLFDTVPGGTGYLKQLMRTETPMMEVFQLALDALQACECNKDPEKDGCYRCLFAYRRSYTMASTSRRAAVALLTNILSARDNLEKTETLDEVTQNALIESELEARFLEVLGKAKVKDAPVRLSKQLIGGKPGYHLEIGSRRYEIEPQVYLDQTKGVRVPSRADFVIRPIRSKEAILPIALFTDGFSYHGDLTGPDTAQRDAILRSGQYRIWTLTYRDVVNQTKSQGSYYTPFLKPSGYPSGDSFDQLIQALTLHNIRTLYEKNSFDLLMGFLAEPDDEQWTQLAMVHALLAADPHTYPPGDPPDSWLDALHRCAPEGSDALLIRPGAYGAFTHKREDGTEEVRMFVSATKDALHKQDPEGIGLVLWFNDVDERERDRAYERGWIGYWQAANLLQFLPGAIFTTANGLSTGAYGGIDWKREITRPMDSDWIAAFDLVHQEHRPFLERMVEWGWPAPEMGYELSDGQGRVSASAEMAWPEKTIALLTDREWEKRGTFEGQGWRVGKLSDALSDPNSIKNFLREEVNQ